MFKHQALCWITLLSLSTAIYAVEPITTTSNNAPETNQLSSPAPLRQNTPSTAANNPLTTTTTALVQKHKQELAQQQQRLQLLEQANQKALSQNQELQLKNDNLSVQVQVLQSERSAQMFIYGAVTFAVGIFTGIIIYSVLYTRRRRQW